METSFFYREDTATDKWVILSVKRQKEAGYAAS
ncbi:hypothetical protein S96127_3981 [Yersinia pestis]|nr:hypothetical protein S96127_3981 [Yersinia pestis]